MLAMIWHTAGRKMPPEKVSLLRAPEVDRDKVRKLIEQARAKLTRSAA